MYTAGLGQTDVTEPFRSTPPVSAVVEPRQVAINLSWSIIELTAAGIALFLWFRGK